MTSHDEPATHHGHTTGPNTTSILRIPSEITQRIFLALKLSDMAKLSETCRYMNQLFKDELPWTRLLANEFGQHPLPEDRSESMQVYKRLVALQPHDATQVRGAFFNPKDGFWFLSNVPGSVSAQPWVLNSVLCFQAYTIFEEVPPGWYRPQFRIMVKERGSGLEKLVFSAYVQEKESGESPMDPLPPSTTALSELTFGDYLASIPTNTWTMIELPAIQLTNSTGTDNTGTRIRSDTYVNVILKIEDYANSFKSGFIIDTMGLHIIKKFNSISEPSFTELMNHRVAIQFQNHLTRSDLHNDASTATGDGFNVVTVRQRTTTNHVGAGAGRRRGFRPTKRRLQSFAEDDFFGGVRADAARE
ncbi:hypothetical protein HDU76_004442 [Blyttiomyces sp. JEL0837]|nr:hypothetical protein HDU76_004442 [Blyttiomyces sp. JEL0837]